MRHNDIIDLEEIFKRRILMTKRLFAVLLACLLILISFTACGTKTPEPGTTAAEDISAAETEANAQTFRSGIRIRRAEHCTEHAETYSK